MKNVIARLWKDEDGIVALEYLLVATIVGLGLVAGLSGLRNCIDAELLELGEAITGLDHDYYITGVGGNVDGASTGSTGDTDVNDAQFSDVFMSNIGETLAGSGAVNNVNVQTP